MACSPFHGNSGIVYTYSTAAVALSEDPTYADEIFSGGVGILPP